MESLSINPKLLSFNKETMNCCKPVLCNLIFLLSAKILCMEQQPVSENTKKIVNAIDSSNSKIEQRLLKLARWLEQRFLQKKMGQIPSQRINHPKMVHLLCWNPDSTILATESLDSTIRLRKVDGQLIREITHKDSSVDNLAWNPSGTILASGLTDRICFWNRNGLKIGQYVTPFDRSISILLWNFDGTNLACVSGNKIYLFDKNCHLITPAMEHQKAIHAIDWNVQGDMIAVASGCNIHIWDLRGHQKSTISLHTEPVYGIKWNDDNTLSSISFDKTMRIFDVAGNELCQPTEYLSNFNTIHLFNPHNEIIACVKEGSPQISLFDGDGRAIGSLEGHDHSIETIEWSPCGSRLASSDVVGIVRLWDFNIPFMRQAFEKLTPHQILLLQKIQMDSSLNQPLSLVQDPSFCTDYKALPEIIKRLLPL